MQQPLAKPSSAYPASDDADKRLFLLPGEMKYSREPLLLSTILGSCVAVCLYDRRQHYGGMNHYMVPEAAGTSLSAGKCGDLAIADLLRLSNYAGSRPCDLVASLYGGGAVIGHLASSAQLSGSDIGARNIALARQVLQQQRIAIVHDDTGGNNGRRITLATDSHQVTVKQIQSSVQTQLQQEKLRRFRQNKIGVLVVDDSRTVRRVLSAAIAGSSDLEVIGEADNPFTAREQLLELAPDVICLDIIMPRMDGVQFLRRLMRFMPIPTVVVSTIATRGSAMRERAMQAGAVSVIDKEDLQLYRGLDVVSNVLLPVLRRAAHVAVSTKQ